MRFVCAFVIVVVATTRELPAQTGGWYDSRGDRATIDRGRPCRGGSGVARFAGRVRSHGERDRASASQTATARSRSSPRRTSVEAASWRLRA